MPILSWNTTPKSDTFNVPFFDKLASGSVAPSTANTAIIQGVVYPTLYKIRKVGVFYTGATAVATTTSFNLVVGTGAYTQGTIAPNDNSFASGTLAPATGTTNGAGVAVTSSGIGYPTNVAGAGMAVFSADLTFAANGVPTGAQAASTYAPGWIVFGATSGYGVFAPPNYDAVYPGLLPMTLRATTASGTTLTNFTVVLFLLAVTPLASPGSGNTTPPFAPGLSF